LKSWKRGSVLEDTWVTPGFLRECWGNNRPERSPRGGGGMCPYKEWMACVFRMHDGCKNREKGYRVEGVGGPREKEKEKPWRFYKKSSLRLCRRPDLPRACGWSMPNGAGWVGRERKTKLGQVLHKNFSAVGEFLWGGETAASRKPVICTGARAGGGGGKRIRNQDFYNDGGQRVHKWVARTYLSGRLFSVSHSKTGGENLCRPK